MHERERWAIGENSRAYARAHAASRTVVFFLPRKAGHEQVLRSMSRGVLIATALKRPRYLERRTKHDSSFIFGN